MKAMQAARLEDQMRRQGLTKLKLVFARLARGEAGMRVYLWAGRVREAQRAANLARIQAALAKQQGQGLNKLRIAFAKIARGEASMRLTT